MANLSYQIPPPPPPRLLVFPLLFLLFASSPPLLLGFISLSQYIKWTRKKHAGSKERVNSVWQKWNVSLYAVMLQSISTTNVCRTATRADGDYIISISPRSSGRWKGEKKNKPTCGWLMAQLHVNMLVHSQFFFHTTSFQLGPPQR